MIRTVQQRLAESLVTLVLASLVSFIALRTLPGDPARLIDGPLASPETRHFVRITRHASSGLMR